MRERVFLLTWLLQNRVVGFLVGVLTHEDLDLADVLSIEMVTHFSSIQVLDMRRLRMKIVHLILDLNYSNLTRLWNLLLAASSSLELGLLRCSYCLSCYYLALRMYLLILLDQELLVLVTDVLSVWLYLGSLIRN
jgi:hypothetical protein